MAREDILARAISRESRAAALPPRVLAALPAEGWTLFAVDDDASDTAAFSARHGVSLEDCANTLVLRFRRDGAEGHAAIVGLASRRLDVNGLVKASLGARRLSFADREAATALTGMEFGAVTAFGLPDGWPLLVDAAVMGRPEVVMGAGLRSAKLLLPPALLAALPGAAVAPLSLG